MTRTLAIAIAVGGLLLAPACGPGGSTNNGTGGTTTTAGIGGGSTGDDGPSGPPTNPTPEESLVRLFEDLAGDVDEAGDCAGLADVLNRWVDANTDRYPQLNEQASERDLSAAQLEEYDGRIQESLVFVVDAIYDCENDSDVQVAFEKFDALMED